MTKRKQDNPGKPALKRPLLKRVVVIEDDAVLAMALEGALLERGVETVVICSSSAAAMHALDAAGTDAVVIDVHLADRDDGWAIAELVAMLGPRPPRIAFSTGSPEDIPPEIAGRGPVFAKPYDCAELARTLCEGDDRSGLLERLRSAIG